VLPFPLKTAAAVSIMYVQFAHYDTRGYVNDPMPALPRARNMKNSTHVHDGGGRLDLALVGHMGICAEQFRLLSVIPVRSGGVACPCSHSLSLHTTTSSISRTA
jgi:hypothetical protein